MLLFFIYELLLERVQLLKQFLKTFMRDDLECSRCSSLNILTKFPFSSDIHSLTYMGIHNLWQLCYIVLFNCFWWPPSPVRKLYRTDSKRYWECNEYIFLWHIVSSTYTFYNTWNVSVNNFFKLWHNLIFFSLSFKRDFCFRHTQKTSFH